MDMDRKFLTTSWNLSSSTYPKIYIYLNIYIYLDVFLYSKKHQRVGLFFF